MSTLHPFARKLLTGAILAIMPCWSYGRVLRFLSLRGHYSAAGFDTSHIGCGRIRAQRLHVDILHAD